MLAPERCTAVRAIPEQLQFLVNRKAVQRATRATHKGKLAVITGATSSWPTYGT